MIDDAAFIDLAARSTSESFCVFCEEPMAPTDPTAPIIPIGEHPDMLVRMCDECLRDYLAWREKEALP